MSTPRLPAPFAGSNSWPLFRASRIEARQIREELEDDHPQIPQQNQVLGRKSQRLPWNNKALGCPVDFHGGKKGHCFFGLVDFKGEAFPNRRQSSTWVAQWTSMGKKNWHPLFWLVDFLGGTRNQKKNGKKAALGQLGTNCLLGNLDYNRKKTDQKVGFGTAKAENWRTNQNQPVLQNLLLVSQS